MTNARFEPIDYRQKSALTRALRPGQMESEGDLYRYPPAYAARSVLLRSLNNAAVEEPASHADGRF